MARSSSQSSSMSERIVGSVRTVAATAVISWLAGSSTGLAQTTWTAGSTVTLNSTFIVSDVLTIEPGVTVRMGTNAVFVVGPMGTLLVEGTSDDPVLFTPQSAAWPGIRFEPGSQGEITGAIIEQCAGYGIEIIGASPVIQASTIRGVGIPSSTSFFDVAGIRVYETHPEQVANPVILGCVIEGVTGRRGSPGFSGSSGDFGGNGANGGLIFPNGDEGENGSSGNSGNQGNVGRPAYGVYLSSGAQATIGYNTIRNILGGKGGTGGMGGTGGSGGRGGHGFDGLALGGNGGLGGRGGPGGWGGTGGLGGIAEAIRVESTNDQVYVFQNIIHGIEAGPGGDGGQKGSGGRGGNGGNGGGCSAPFCIAGNGGNGLAGGAAGTGGASGNNAGTAGLATVSNAGSLAFVNNTVADLRRGVGGNPGPGGSGGSGGTGGARGIASGTGSNGSSGFNGLPGANSGAGTVSGSIGTTRGVIVSGSGAQAQLFNNIVMLGGVGTMLASSSGGLIWADYNNFFGFQTLASGSNAMGTHNIQTDPLFVDSAEGDFRLSTESAAIDAGSNAELPLDVFDLDNDGDTTEPIPFDHAGNLRVTDDDHDTVAIVEIGALEGGFAPVLLPYHNAADQWLVAAGSSEAYAFDEFYPGIANGGGCLAGGSMDPVVIALDGGTLSVSAFQAGNPICAIVDGSTTPAVSDANLSSTNGDGMVVFEFNPPVTAFYTYFGSLATGQTATMDLFTSDRGDAVPFDSITSSPSTTAVLASGLGFRSPVPVHRVEITMTELGGASIGAFVGLVANEPSLGTINIPGYVGPNGSTVELDFACVFKVVETPPCDPDITGDGVVNFADLNAVLSAFGQSGENLPADTNGDGVVNFGDLNAILAAFGTNCPS